MRAHIRMIQLEFAQEAGIEGVHLIFVNNVQKEG